MYPEQAGQVISQTVAHLLPETRMQERQESPNPVIRAERTKSSVMSKSPVSLAQPRGASARQGTRDKLFVLDPSQLLKQQR
jgi:hypothetical protein